MGITNTGNYRWRILVLIFFPTTINYIVAEWFPKKERALATGLFNSGSSIGAVAFSNYLYPKSNQ